MKVKVWGARGSVPAPGPEMNRYGGNTSCVELELSDGSTPITDGPTTLTYISDHEPGLGAPLESLEPEWISGFDLARDSDLLIHDCQFTDEEYPDHVGWGHSRLSDTLLFARRVEAERLMLFH